MLDKNQRVVIALGYFDCVHKGHRKVIGGAFALAEKLNAKPVVFTFDGNLKGAIKGEREKNVYTTTERMLMLREMGVNDVYCAPINKQFLGLEAKAFLDKINSELNIVGYVTGDDYRFGYKGKGDVEFLTVQFESHGHDSSILQGILEGDFRLGRIVGYASRIVTTSQATHQQCSDRH